MKKEKNELGIEICPLTGLPGIKVIDGIPRYDCVLCGKKGNHGYGNNPMPFEDFGKGRACERCNGDVITERFMQFFKSDDDVSKKIKKK